MSTKLPPYLFDLTPSLQRSHRNQGCLTAFQCRTELFQNLFWPCFVNKWKKLDPSIRCIESHSLFRKKLLEFIRPIGNSTYRIHDPIGIKLLNRLRLSFSHLREHTIRHSFPDTLNPLCACALETECTQEHGRETFQFLMCRTLFSTLTQLHLTPNDSYERVTWYW